MPLVRQTTKIDGKTVVLREFPTKPPPSTRQKQKEANETALLPAQPRSKTPKPSSANQPNLVQQNDSKVLSCVEDLDGNLKVFDQVRKINDDSMRDGEKPAAVSKNAGGENLATDEAVAEKSKGAKVVEEKKKPKLCCCDN